MRIRALFLGLLTTTLGLAGSPAATAAPAVATPFDFVASLEKNGSHFCTGSLIKANWVVTAKHCVVGTSPSSVVARVGSTGPSNPGQLAKVSQFVQHPSLDLALLRLATNVTLQPIRIPLTAAVPGTATKVIFLMQGRPRELNSRILSDTACRNINGPGEICTEIAPNPPQCSGWSGAPQVRLVDGVRQLIGAASRPAVNPCQGPFIYTDVPPLRNWISAHAGALPSSVK